ncbi:type II toxin-antitoxin system Phd/YefM family antitoxin [Actinomadura sp. 6N118]|uniref:type II toxin-antitoxin system Phd/YefM family antitoxin n=1 Tax=Actinomadura sp. 6N118 TaxID=3375151 RepID=UPI0037A46F08
MSITAGEARRRLFPLIEEVNNNAAAIEIVSKNGSAFLVPEAEYRSLQEIAYLMRSPVNRERLLASYQEALEGRCSPHDLIEVGDGV